MPDERESSLLDGGAPFYRTYESADGKYMRLARSSRSSTRSCSRGMGLSPDEVPNQLDPALFAEMRKLFADRFATKTRAECTQIFAGTHACVTPVLTWTEASPPVSTSRHAQQSCTRTVLTRPPRRRGSRAPAGPPSRRRWAPRPSMTSGGSQGA